MNSTIDEPKVTPIIDQTKIEAIKIREVELFKKRNPKSLELSRKCRTNMLNGVPMHWMADCSTPYPSFFKEGLGAHIKDVDGHELVDFCLGGTGSLFGYAHPKIVEAIHYQAAHGASPLMPTEDAFLVGSGMQRIFGLPSWQVTVSASEANRVALRLSQMLTRRKTILIFHYCYHGTVDEAWWASIDVDQTEEPPSTTRIVEFNDIEAVEKALADEKVACLMTEPALTNSSIVHPNPGYHEALREITRKTGTMLIMDETQTIGAGFGGYSRLNNLAPDMIVMGKPMAGGIPVGLVGFSDEISERITNELFSPEEHFHYGMGGTLAGSPLQMRAIHATLEHVMTEDNYRIMQKRSDQLQKGMEAVLEQYQLPWCVVKLGARTELYTMPTPPQTATEAINAQQMEFEQCLNLYAMNRDVILSPYNNTAVCCPALNKDDVTLYIQVFGEFLQELRG